MKQKVLSLFLCIVSAIYAQPNGTSNIDELHTQKWEFIVEKAKLSSQEAERVKPLFLEYEKAVWSSMERNKDFFHDFYRNKTNRGEAQYAEMNERYMNAEIQKAHLLKSYYAKLKKQLSAESIFKYFNAERSFRKELMDKWQDRPRRARK